MDAILRLLIAVLVFALLWFGIGVIPEPRQAQPNARPLPWRWVLYLLLIIGAVWWLWTRYGL